MSSLEQLLELSKKRIDFFHTKENVRNWYRGSDTYFRGVIEEMQEVGHELAEHNHIYLEDELGDVLWNYLCLLESLAHEGKISSRERVFERSYTKLSGRIGENADGGHNWDEVKKTQKECLQHEHECFYGKPKAWNCVSQDTEQVLVGLLQLETELIYMLAKHNGTPDTRDDIKEILIDIISLREEIRMGVLTKQAEQQKKSLLKERIKKYSLIFSDYVS